MRLLLAVGVLATLTAGHWLISTSESRAFDRITPLAVGHVFSVELDGIYDLPTGCLTAYVVDPGCRGCQELARRLGRAPAVVTRANVVWISAAPEVRTLEFAASHGLPPARVFAVRGADVGTPAKVLRKLGLAGVPTRMVIDASRRINDLQLGGTPPEDGEFGDLCSLRAEFSSAR